MQEIICQRHILNQCPKCFSDELNKQCIGYKPISLWTFSVKDKLNENTNLYSIMRSFGNKWYNSQRS